MNEALDKSALPAECHGCGRTDFDTVRIFAGGRFCATCYAREFKHRACTSCLGPVRLHLSRPTGQCERCIRAERDCLRCGRPCPRAALIIAGKAVCPSCRPHFVVPAATRATPDNYANCTCCRKPRAVAGHREDGRPLCAACAQSDRTVEVAAQESAYWLGRVVCQTPLAVAALTEESIQRLFEEFIEDATLRSGPKKVALKLPFYTRAFVTISGRCTDADALAMRPLTELFPAERLRRWRSITDFLARRQLGGATPEQRVASVEQQRCSDIVGRAPEFAIRKLNEYSEALATAVPGGKVALPTTRRLNLRAASALLCHCGAALPTQVQLEQFVAKHRGHRNALARFVKHLGTQGHPLTLPSVVRRRKAACTSIEFEEQLGRLLSVSCSPDASVGAQRSSLAAALSALTALPLRHVVALKRDRFRIHDGQWTLEVDGEPAQLPPALHEPVTRLVGDSYGGDFAFPGVIAGQPLSVSAVAYHLKNAGISILKLRMAGRAQLKKSSALGRKSQ